MAQLQGGDFAVVLLDVQMPTMDGFETAVAMQRLLREGARRIPIIFLTAIDSDGSRVARAYAHGAVDFIQKPFDPSILRAKVSVFVELYLARQRRASDAEEANTQKRDAAHRDFLATAGEALVSSLDYRETLATVARLAVPQLADWCAVDLLEPGAREHEQLAVAHVDPAKIALARELRETYPPDPNATAGAPQVIRTGQPELYPELPAELLEAGARDARHLELIRRLKLESAMVVPLTAHGRTLGAMTFIYADSGRRYSEADLAFASDFARRAAMAIENTLALRDAQAAREAERRARDRIARMQEFTAAMSRARTASEVAEAACEIGTRALDALTGALWIRRDDGSLELAGTNAHPVTLVDHFRVIPADAKGTPALEVVRTGQAVWIETEEDYRRVAPEIFEKARTSGHVRSYGASPLWLDGQVAGVVVFTHPVGHQYTEDERQFHATLGHHCAQALHRARLLDAERRTNDRLRLLAAAGETLARSLDPEQTMQAVARLAVPGFCDWCVVDLVEGQEIRRVATAHSDPELAEAARLAAQQRPGRLDDPGGVARVIADKRPRFFPRVPAEVLALAARNPEHRAILDKSRIVSSIVLPLMSGDTCFGALSFTTSESGRVYGEDDLRFAQELGHRAALAIANARLYRSAQDAAAQAERANRIKDEFLATVSHELRTPLNAINGWAVLLAGKMDDRATLEKGLEVIRRNARTQMQIVEDILDVSRIVTGKMNLDIAPTDVVAVARDAMEVVRPSAESRQIALQLKALEDQGYVVMADAARMQQVMWNLLSNAIKFTPPGGVVTMEVNQDGPNVVVSVADTGKGIDPGFLPHVFDRFVQADGSTTRRFGGLGLGLAIVRHIVELHGGRVSVQSPGPDQGATFAMVLPQRGGEL